MNINNAVLLEVLLGVGLFTTIILVLVFVILCSSTPAIATTVFYGPSAYLSSADSPFLGAVIEDFEDETKTTLGELAEDALEMLGVRPSDKN